MGVRVDRETPGSRWGGLAPGWLDAPPSAEGWLAAPPPLDGWLDAPPSEIARGGLHAQSAVSVTSPSPSLYEHVGDVGEPDPLVRVSVSVRARVTVSSPL